MGTNTQSLQPVSRGGSGEMFDKIAERYDRVNRILSLGLDQRWRRTTICKLNIEAAHRVLDLATGTGDLAILEAGVAGSVTGLDPSENMLAVAKRKVARKGLSSKLELVLGDAQALPFESNAFDRISIAFGIRNVSDRSLGLREMFRVLKPGGRVGILELNEPKTGFLSSWARLYIRNLVPRIGALVSGAKEYRYLQASIAEFPDQGTFAKLMKHAGFTEIECYPLTFGVCTLFVGDKE